MLNQEKIEKFIAERRKLQRLRPKSSLLTTAIAATGLLSYIISVTVL